MSYIIVGSKAALAQDAIQKRVPKDTDIFAGNEDDITEYCRDFNFEPLWERTIETPKGKVMFDANGGILEVELGTKCENVQAIIDAMDKDWSRIGIYAHIDWLYFLKMSHRFKKDSPHFFKTMNDIHDLRRRGAKMPEGSEALFKERERLTYTYKHPNLKVDKDKFFKGDEVPYIYDHDSIHVVVALDGAPAYTKYMKEGEQVMCSKEKFMEAPLRVRILGGLEEALVLTAERSLIPNDFKPDPDRMFVFALSKVCTSITSGWFREWCWENFYRILHTYDKECKGVWVEKVKKAIAENQLLPYNGNSMY